MKCQKNRACVKQPQNSPPDYRKKCTGCDKIGKDKGSNSYDDRIMSYDPNIDPKCLQCKFFNYALALQIWCDKVGIDEDMPTKACKQFKQSKTPWVMEEMLIKEGQIYGATNKPVVLIIKPKGTDNYELMTLDLLDPNKKPMNQKQLQKYLKDNNFELVGEVIEHSRN